MKINKSHHVVKSSILKTLQNIHTNLKQESFLLLHWKVNWSHQVVVYIVIPVIIFETFQLDSSSVILLSLTSKETVLRKFWDEAIANTFLRRQSRKQLQWPWPWKLRTEKRNTHHRFFFTHYAPWFKCFLYWGRKEAYKTQKANETH